MRSIARAFYARNFCYVDVRAVWCVSRVVSGIRADTVFDEQPHVDRRGLSEIEQSPFRVIRRLCVSPLGRHTNVARNFCYVDVRAVWRVARVVSGIRADTVSDTMCSPMSIDAGCGGSRVGLHSCSITWDTPDARKGTWSPIYWSVWSYNRVSLSRTWGIPVS